MSDPHVLCDQWEPGCSPAYMAFESGKVTKLVVCYREIIAPGHFSKGFCYINWPMTHMNLTISEEVGKGASIVCKIFVKMEFVEQ